LPRKRWWIAAVAIIAVASFAAIPAAGRTVELTPIRVAFVPGENAGQVMYAKHRAIFRKQGLDVELKPLLEGSVAALLSGQVQFASSPLSSVAKLKSDGAPIQVVAAGALYNPKKPTSALVSARGKTISRARDLVGKTIALDQAFTIADLGVRQWLRKNGVDPKDVKYTYAAFPLMLAPLEKGTFDAAILPEPWLTQALQRGSKRIANVFSAVCTTPCQVTYWFAKAGADENVVARFRNAIQRAAVWANQEKNYPISGKILAKYTDIEAAVIKKMTRATYGTRLRVSLAKEWLAVFAEYGLIPSSFRPIDLVK
jgi:NitT/TauT family transport system substrate-binding protein